jgi:hypothetical protein
MSPRNIKAWQEFFIAATVVAALQMVFMEPPAEAAVDTLSPNSPVANISTMPVEPGTAAASSICEDCDMPAMLREQSTGLVITTSLSDGSHVSVWQNKYDNLVYGQCYSSGGQPRSDFFRINADAEDGVLPIILARKDGGFVAVWEKDCQRHEQRFNATCTPLGNEARLK